MLRPGPCAPEVPMYLPTGKNKDQQTPLDVAKHHDHQEIVEMIREKAEEERA